MIDDLSGFANALGVSPSSSQSPISEELLDNLKHTESGKNPYAVNKETKAMGAYQFMPDTVAMLHKQGIKFNPFDETEARNAARTYLEQLTAKNGGDVKKAVAQYGGFVTKNPDQYVSKVMPKEQPSSEDFDLQGFANALQGQAKPETKTAKTEIQAQFDNKKQPSMLESGLAGAGGSVVKSLGSLEQLAGKGIGFVAPETGKTIEQNALQNLKGVNQFLQPYEQANPKSYLAGEVVGAVANPINKVIPGGAATGLVGKVAQAAGQGALANVLTTPVTDENKDFLTEKAKQATVGALGGGVAGGLFAGAGKIAQPVESALSKEGENAVKVLREAGVPIDVSQATGSEFLKRTKAASMDNPFTATKEEAFSALQRKAYNKAIAKTMGEDAEAITPDVLQRAKERLGGIYDDLATRHQIAYDDVLKQNLNSIRDRAEQVLPEQNFPIIKKQIDSIINKANANGGKLNGNQYKAAKEVLDDISAGGGTPGQYAREIKESLLDSLSRSAEAAGNKTDVSLLKATNKQYGNFKKIEDVVLKNGEGDVNPATLMNSLATKGKRYSFYQDDPELANLARAGKLVLQEKLPNSGTYARLMAGSPVFSGMQALYQKGAQAAMRNPATAQYLEQGLPQGVGRNIIQTPQRLGQMLPQYMQKPGAVGGSTLRDIVNQRNLEAQQ